MRWNALLACCVTAIFFIPACLSPSDEQHHQHFALSSPPSCVEQCPVHERLLEGVIWIDYSGGGQSGGNSAFHQLHHVLNEQGFDSVLHKADPAKVTQFTHERACRADEMSPGDVVIINDLLLDPARRSEYDRVVAAYRQAGAQVVLWLTMANVVGYKPRGVHLLASSAWMHRAYVVPGLHVVYAPLDHAVYAASHAYSTAPHSASKTNLVLLDDDTLILAPPLEWDFHAWGAHNGIVFRLLSGFSRAETLDLFRNASAIVDFHVQGNERANLEAALFDCVVLLSADQNGRDLVDFPVHHSLRVDRFDRAATFTAIFNAVYSYPDLLPKFAPLKSFAHTLPSVFQRESALYFRNRALLVVTAATTERELYSLWPWLLSVLVQYPLAAVEIWVPDNSTDFLTHFGGLPILHLLDWHGWLLNVRFSTIPTLMKAYGSLAVYFLEPTLFRPFTWILPVETLMVDNEGFNCLLHCPSTGVPYTNYFPWGPTFPGLSPRHFFETLPYHASVTSQISALPPVREGDLAALVLFQILDATVGVNPDLAPSFCAQPLLENGDVVSFSEAHTLDECRLERVRRLFAHSMWRSVEHFFDSRTQSQLNSFRIAAGKNLEPLV